jgi:CheY-like chemotaxis protein
MPQTSVNGDAEADGRIRLLLVDPYGGSREGLEAALRGAGLTVVTADGASAAIGKMRNGEVDLAVIDLDLPAAHGVAEDGWELVRILRAANPDTQADARRLGAACLLEKPINPRELRKLIRALRPETAPA